MNADSDLVHSVVDTAASETDVTQVGQLLHGDETQMAGDAGYTVVHKRPEHKGRAMILSIFACPVRTRKYAKKSLDGRAKRKIEYVKTQVRAKVELPFRVTVRQFGYPEVRFRGMVKTPLSRSRSLRGRTCGGCANS